MISRQADFEGHSHEIKFHPPAVAFTYQGVLQVAETQTRSVQIEVPSAPASALTITLIPASNIISLNSQAAGSAIQVFPTMIDEPVLTFTPSKGGPQVSPPKWRVIKPPCYRFRSIGQICRLGICIQPSTPDFVLHAIVEIHGVECEDLTVGLHPIIAVA
jgi:hypothetical protein